MNMKSTESFNYEVPIYGDTIGEAKKGKIVVLIEQHFDPTELLRFNDFYPQNGYQVQYATHLWGNPSVKYYSNPDDNGIIQCGIVVEREVNNINLNDCEGIILIGGYATDRMRYQSNPAEGQPNNAPAVEFVRNAMNNTNVIKGTICHSLWLLCADTTLTQNRKVTCASNIICDVENAGAKIIYNGNQTAEVHVDNDLVSGQHPGVVEKFMKAFLLCMEKARKPQPAMG